MIIGVVVGLTFLFGFGNVLSLALQLGVPTWVAPLVAPTVNLSILGLLLGTRHLALHGATPEQLRPAHRLLIFTSTTTLALNIANPLVTGAYGKAAFNAVGPPPTHRLGGVGPALLQAIGTIGTSETTAFEADTRCFNDDPPMTDTDDGAARSADSEDVNGATLTPVPPSVSVDGCDAEASPTEVSTDDGLLDRARRAGAQHLIDHPSDQSYKIHCF